MVAKEGQRIRAKNSLPSPIQCGWETVGCALTDGTHTDRRNGAWSDETWPRYGPPLPHAGREKQSATMCRQPSTFPGRTWKGLTMASSPRRDHRAS